MLSPRMTPSYPLTFGTGSIPGLKWTRRKKNAMAPDDLQKEAATPVDEAMKRALEQAWEEAQLRGTVTPKQSRINARVP